MNNTSPLGRKALLLMLPLSLMPSLGVASDSSLSAKFENDGFASSDDGHFTSGFELNWTFTPQASCWLRALRQHCPIALLARRTGRLIVWFTRFIRRTISSAVR